MHICTSQYLAEGHFNMWHSSAFNLAIGGQSPVCICACSIHTHTHTHASRHKRTHTVREPISTGSSLGLENFSWWVFPRPPPRSEPGTHQLSEVVRVALLPRRTPAGKSQAHWTTQASLLSLCSGPPSPANSAGSLVGQENSKKRK